MGFGETPDFRESLYQKGMGGAVEEYLSQALEKSEFDSWNGGEKQPILDLKQERKELEVALKKEKDLDEKKSIEVQIVKLTNEINQSTIRNYEAMFLDWITRLNQTKRPFSQRLLLFWHNLFAISREKVDSHLYALYLDRLSSEGLSNWGEMLLKIAREPAMLQHLDNLSNVKGHPNENFARELMELFSLGIGNYTEREVQEAARAFTGWTLDEEKGCFVFNEAAHDSGVKSFFGKEGNWGGEDIISMILNHPESTRFLAKRIWNYFVYENPEPPLIEELSELIRRSKFDLKIIFRAVFQSKAFYSVQSRGTQVKSPVLLVAGTLRLLNQRRIPSEMIDKTLRLMGMELVHPPEVNGWPSGYQWINTSTLLLRYNFINLVIHGKMPRQMRDRNEPKARAISFNPQELFEEKRISSSTEVVDYLLELLVQRPLASDLRDRLIKYIETDKSGGSSSFDMKGQSASEKIKGLIHLILSSPDYQLC